MSAILVLDAHPNPHSLTAAIAATYAEAAEAHLIPLRDLDFDVHMRFGYTKHLPVEPDLAEARQAIHAARHLVIATPLWWRSIPALLKGFLDRALLPQEEYRFTSRGLPVGLLKGRSAHVFITADTPCFLQLFMSDSRLRSLTHGTLRLCGFKPVRTTRFAPVKKSTPEQRATWLATVRQLAEKERARVADTSASSPQPASHRK